MKRFTGIMTASALVFSAALACGPSDDSFDDSMDEMGTDMEATGDALAMEFSQFRNEVSMALADIQADVQELEADVSMEAQEEWRELSTSAQRTHDDMMADMDRMSRASREEVWEIRQAASQRLAELEADIIRRELRNADDPAVFSARVNEQLSKLQVDIGELSTRMDVQADTDDLAERLAGLRLDLAQVVQRSGEEFAEAREELSDSVADLTRDVRHEWYKAEWSGTTG